jgi:hypothetical protein
VKVSWLIFLKMAAVSLNRICMEMYQRNHYTPDLILILDCFDQSGYFAIQFRIVYMMHNLTQLAYKEPFQHLSSFIVKHWTESAMEIP